MALQAKIKKKFSGFTLDVEFETKEGCMGISVRRVVERA